MNSKISGKLYFSENGEYVLITCKNGTYSGSPIAQMWREALLPYKDRDIKSTLILGLGGGSVILPIKELWDTSITGYEIDEDLINESKKYFDYQDTKIIIDDAYNATGKYDLIIFDVFINTQTPNKFKTPQYYKKLKSLSNGLILINKLDKIEVYET